jgi:hypothetical protein
MTFSYRRDGSPATEPTVVPREGPVSLDLGGDPITDLARRRGVAAISASRRRASSARRPLSATTSSRPPRDEGALRDRLRFDQRADRGTSRAGASSSARPRLQTRVRTGPVAEDAVTETTAQLQAGEDPPAPGARPRRLAVARDHRAEAETALLERRSMLEKAWQASD